MGGCPLPWAATVNWWPHGKATGGGTPLWVNVAWSEQDCRLWGPSPRVHHPVRQAAPSPHGRSALSQRRPQPTSNPPVPWPHLSPGAMCSPTGVSEDTVLHLTTDGGWPKPMLLTPTPGNSAAVIPSPGGRGVDGRAIGAPVKQVPRSSLLVPSGPGSGFLPDTEPGASGS